jgi:hypothetical protein
MTEYALVHINVFRPLGTISIEDPNAQFFFSQLPGIFAAADDYLNMYWHNHALRTMEGDFLTFEEVFAAADQGFANPDVITMAGWKDVSALHQFAYRFAQHRDGMKKLRDWRDRTVGATMAMWWAPKSERITIRNGWEKINQLRRDGPSQDVFTLQTRFDPPPDDPTVEASK